jgi:hypothetical protein
MFEAPMTIAGETAGQGKSAASVVSTVMVWPHVSATGEAADLAFPAEAVVPARDSAARITVVNRNELLDGSERRLPITG